MTKAADTGDIVPTASVVVQGALHDSLIHLAPGRSDGIAAGSQPLRCKQRGCFVQSLIDIGAVLFAAFFTVLLIAAAVTAPLALLLLFLMFV